MTDVYVGIEAFVHERNEALLSLDRRKIEAFMAKYGVPQPKDDLSFWVGIHKARLEVTAFPDNVKNVSREWLRAHSMASLGGEKL